MKKTVLFCPVWCRLVWGNGYTEMESDFFGLAKKVLMVLETLLNGEVACIKKSLRRLKFSDQKIACLLV